MIGIVTDGAASLDPGVPAAEAILVVPMQLEVDGRPLEEAGVSVEEVDELLTSGGAGRLATSAPSPGAFLQAIEEADRGDGVVVLTVSAKMSSTYSAAVVAARMAAGRVEVVDTGTAAGAEALVALAAQAEATAGGSFEAVVKQAALSGGLVRMIAEVGDLHPLAHSGRIPDLVARLGTSLGVRPLFEYRRGSVSAQRPARSEKGATDAMLAAWRKSTPGVPSRLHVTASYGSDRDAAERLISEVSREAAPATAFVARFGPVMVAHTGGDILGLSWWWEPLG